MNYENENVEKENVEVVEYKEMRNINWIVNHV